MKTITLDVLFEMAKEREFPGISSERLNKWKPLYVAVIKRSWDETEAIDVVRYMLREDRPLEYYPARRAS